MTGITSRRVLLVDSDVDALGALASALRARGLAVTIASAAFDAVEQAFKRRPDVVLAARSVDEHSALTGAFAAVPELSDTPILFLVDRKPPSELGPDSVPRGDVDHIVSRISDASPRGSRPSPQEIRGDLQQAPLVDLLQLLAMNRRSGVLGITTPNGAGEVRLAGGEVIDAVYRRLEGQKALYRLLGEREGHFAFSPGEPTSARRITAPTSRLLMDALRHVDEVRRRRVDLAPAGEAFFLEEPPPVDPDLPPVQSALRDAGSVPPPPRSTSAPPTRSGSSLPPRSGSSRPPRSTSSAPTARGGSWDLPTGAGADGGVMARDSTLPPPTLRAAEQTGGPFLRDAIGASSVPPGPSEDPQVRADVEAQLLVLLQMPYNLDELLDEISAPDLTILEVLADFASAGKVRRVSLADLTTPFAPPEQLPVLRSMVTRLAHPGFAPPPRLVIAASARRMPTLSHAIRRIAEAAVPAEPPPRSPLPQLLGVLRLGDGVELTLAGLPTVDAFHPTWPLALHGAAAVIRLDDAGGEALEAHCEALELLLIDAESMMGALDLAAPGQIAALVRASLEMAAGV